MERLTRISLETSKLAYELGYTWKSDINYYYFEGKLVRDWLIPPFGNQEAYLAPEKDLLRQWLLTKDIYSTVYTSFLKGIVSFSGASFTDYNSQMQELLGKVTYYPDYNDAFEEALKRGLIILKDKLNKDMK